MGDIDLPISTKFVYLLSTENVPWEVIAIRDRSARLTIGDPPQDFNAKGESTRTTRFHFKTKEFILTRFSTLAILPH